MCRTINALRKGRKSAAVSVPFTEEQLTVMCGGLTARRISVEADTRVGR